MIRTDISALLPFIPEGIEPWLAKAEEAAVKLNEETAFAGFNDGNAAVNCFDGGLIVWENRYGDRAICFIRYRLYLQR